MKKRRCKIAAMALVVATALVGNCFGGISIQNVNAQEDTASQITQYEGYSLVWNDEFDGEYLDKTKWSLYSLPKNGSHIYNTSTTEDGELENENVYLKDGALQLKATLMDEPVTEGNNTYYTKSGMVQTYKKASWRYGRFDIRAKLPVTTGMWPAIWMMPENAITWPQSGEIDIMELVSQQPSTVFGTIHSGVYGTTYYYHPSSTYKLQSGTFYDEYHLFSLEWEPGVLRYYVDNVLYATFTDWDGSKKDTTTDTTTVMDSPYPFNNEFYLKLNLATGKSSGWCENISDNTDWDNAVMSIDYVRVYKKTDASYTYSQDAYTSTKYPQGPVWYAQIQGTEEGTWENLSTYENNTWSQDGVSITKNSITANEKDAAIAFVAPEDGYVTLHLEKEAVSDGDFTLKVAKGTYSSTECTFGADEETVAQWKVTGQDGTYTTTDATTDLVIQVKADDVLRLEASGNGNVIQNVTPVITYTEEPEVTEPEETETETETTAPETTVPETSSTEETVDTDKTPSTSTPVTEAPTTEAPAAETTATEAAKETVTKVTKPAKPKLTVKKSGKTMRLSWKKVKGADGYEVFMKTGSGKYKRIAVKGKTVTSLKKKGAAGKKYTFRVRAYKKNGTTKVYGSYSAAKTIKISK